MDRGAWWAAHRFFQARILEWVAMPSSRGFSQPRYWTHISCVSCIADQLFTVWAIGEAKLSSLRLFKVRDGDFPGGLVVKTLPSNAGSTGLLPGQGAKILQASHPKNQKHRSNIVTNSVKTFKMVHIKNIFKKIKNKVMMTINQQIFTDQVL